MKIQVWIPSRGRPDCRTAELVAGLAPLVVVEPQEADDYARFNPIRLPRGNAGLAYARNFVMKQMASAIARAEVAWMLDDDITGFFRVMRGKCVRADGAEVLREASERLLNAGEHIGQGALEYQQFAWSNRRGYTPNSYCDVAVAFFPKRWLPAYDPAMELKEDRDVTLQTLQCGFSTLRLATHAFAAPPNGSNQGGLHSEYARAGREAEAVNRMVAKWPGVCTRQVKASGRPDLNIEWRKFKAS